MRVFLELGPTLGFATTIEDRKVTMRMERSFILMLRVVDFGGGGLVDTIAIRVTGKVMIL